MTPIVLVVAETKAAGLAPVVRESVGVARRLSGPDGVVVGFAAGTSARTSAEELARWGVARVMLAEDARFDSAPTGAVAHAAAAAARGSNATLVVVGSTTFGRDLAGRLAVVWEATAATGVTEAEPEGSELRIRRPVFGGRATETRHLVGPRMVLAIRPHAFPSGADAPVALTAEPLGPVEVPAGLWAPKRLEVRAPTGGAGPSLTEAAIVVSGGRGLRGPEEFKLVEELAAALGAAVGASRAVTDAGWRPASYQVGQTGRAVSPQLYIAVGISGAIQHLVGMLSSRVIVAINSDPSAPIFRVADYGLVGDAFAILPALTAETKRARSA